MFRGVLSRGHVGRSGDSEAQGESADPQTFGWAGKQLRKTVKLLTSKHLPRHLKARMGPQRFLLPKRHKRGMIAGGHPLDRTLVAGVETAGVIRPGSGEPGRGARTGRTVPTHGVPEIRELQPGTGIRKEPTLTLGVDLGAEESGISSTANRNLLLALPVLCDHLDVLLLIAAAQEFFWTCRIFTEYGLCW